MTPLRTYIFTVGDGVYMPQVDAFRHSLKYLPAGQYALITKSLKEKRSLNQNKLLWLWLTEIADETGNEPKIIHEHLRHEFLWVADTAYPYARSTTDLNTKEFKEYLDKVELWAKEMLNMTLTDPNMLGLVEE